MKKILIVEDDIFLRGLLIEKLGKEGFEVFGAETGEGGAKKVREIKPDVVLLDIMLPGIDGFAVLSWIKQDKELSGTSVIILSNLGREKDIQRGLKLGAENYLIKSKFTPKEILEKIRAALDK